MKLARKRKQPSQLEQQYQKELRRIKQFIRRAEKRGYEFTEDIIPKKPKRITQASIRNLQKRDANYLYKKATAISEETGQVITGQQKRKEENKKRSQRAAETRRRRKEAQAWKRQHEQLAIDEGTYPMPDVEPAPTPEPDNIQLQLLFNEGKITYDRVESLIDDTIKTGAGWGGVYLRELLAEQIKTYGFNATMMAIGQAPEEIITYSQIIIEESDKGIVRQAIANIKHLIEGNLPTDEELRMLDDIISMDEYSDEDITF